MERHANSELHRVRGHQTISLPAASAAIQGTARADDRIALFAGSTPAKSSESSTVLSREDIKQAFNADPAKHPLRILIASDAAREGLNLQAHCWNLFHFNGSSGLFVGKIGCRRRKCNTGSSSLIKIIRQCQVSTLPLYGLRSRWSKYCRSSASSPPSDAGRNSEGLARYMIRKVHLVALSQ